ETRYLLGDRPTAADCIVLGGLRAHVGMDPDPKEVLAGFPRVSAWAERDLAAWDGGGELAGFPASTPFAQTVLAELRDHYLPVLVANVEAHRAGAKAFTAESYGERVSFLTRPYPVRSWRMIQQRLARLGEPGRRTVLEWAETRGLAP